RCLTVALPALIELSAAACMWDSDTLADEQRKSPTLAQAILTNAIEAPDAPRLRDRITKLHREPRRNDAAWWNDLAGAHLRLGEAREAAAILEPVLERFPGDYGIHANLGTAYHLLGRYAEAAKEIARDLEINPDGNLGREKYHLALLQYLTRDAAYRKDHVYVDEFSDALLHQSWDKLGLINRAAVDLDAMRFEEEKL